jgi:hypothetical protein
VGESGNVVGNGRERKLQAALVAAVGMEHQAGERPDIRRDSELSTVAVIYLWS